jgi:hypothetical protein
LYSYQFEDCITVNNFKKGEIDNHDLEIGNFAVHETNDWIISEWPDPNNKNPAKVIYHSKKNNTTIVSKGFFNDITGVLGTLVKTNLTNNQLFSVLNSVDIITNKEVISQFPKNNVLQVDSIKITDNPVIQILHFK